MLYEVITHHRRRHEVLRGDQLEALVLSSAFVLEGPGDLGIGGLHQLVMDGEELLLEACDQPIEIVDLIGQRLELV